VYKLRKGGSDALAICAEELIGHVAIYPRARIIAQHGRGRMRIRPQYLIIN
jgi:hypothetical protein